MSEKKFFTPKKTLLLKIFLSIASLLIIWILIDFYGPWSANLRKFNPVVIAQLETKMWRAYYDKKPAELYYLLVIMLREQNKLPFWQANLTAYYAAKAAFAFKEGKSRADYEKAIPYLQNYFASINHIGNMSSNTQELAKLELEWWIVHRERKTYGEQALVNAIAETSAKFYGVEINKLNSYAEARTKAMLYRDNQQELGKVTEEDWKAIETDLTQAYTSLVTEINH